MPCTSRLTNISGFVFFERTRLICWLRSMRLMLSTGRVAHPLVLAGTTATEGVPSLRFLQEPAEGLAWRVAHICRDHKSTKV